MIRFSILAVLTVIGFLFVHPKECDADPPTPIKLNFSSYDSMTIPDCLRVISMETGDIILPDASVNGFVGAINVTKDNVPDMLSFLKAYEPGLTYQIVYYPGSPPEPDGEQLYQQIQEIKSLTIAGVVLPASGDDNTMLTFREDQYVTPDAQQKAVNGMREIYLVSDPINRALMKKAASAAPPTAKTTSVTGPGQFNATLQTLVQQIAQMNPQQQSVAMQQLFAAQRQINMSLDPSVLAGMHGTMGMPHHPGAIPVGSSGPSAQ